MDIPTFELQLLGTGDSAQVPVYNCDCSACVAARLDVSHQRLPCSAVLRFAGQTWLIDSGLMDLTTRFPAPQLSGILQTHYHADHAQGLLHLRWGVGIKIPVWGPADPVGFADLYKHPGILDFSRPWQAFESRQLAGCTITALPLTHSKPCFGYVIESSTRCIAYLTDTVGLPEPSYAWLKNKPLDVCIVDCSQPPRTQTPRNHNDVTSALSMCEGLAIKQLVFTHIGHELDVWLQTHRSELPGYVQIASDGMVF